MDLLLNNLSVSCATMGAPVCAHRVMVKNHHEGPAERRREADNVLREILETTQVPL